MNNKFKVGDKVRFISEEEFNLFCTRQNTPTAHLGETYNSVFTVTGRNVDSWFFAGRYEEPFVWINNTRGNWPTGGCLNSRLKKVEEESQNNDN